MNKEQSEIFREFQSYAKLDRGIDFHLMSKCLEQNMPNIHMISNTRAGEIKAQTPVVIEERPMNATAMDVFSRLMMERIIFLGQGIDDYIANIVVAQLLFLDSTDNSKDIEMYINSPGGVVSAGLSIYDTMHYIKVDVSTITTGMAASMAFVLAISGTKGKRFSLPNARYMQHQPMGGVQGQASDILIQAKEIEKTKNILYQIISSKTDQSIETITKDADRDHWMSAHQAKEYGCLDTVVEINDGVDYTK